MAVKVHPLVLYKTPEKWASEVVHYITVRVNGTILKMVYILPMASKDD